MTVIVLTGQEKLHGKRCLERLAPLNPRQVLVVESQSMKDSLMRSEV